MSQDLTKLDVVRYLLEEYFKDGVLEDAEKENIRIINEVLGISQRDYIRIFIEVNERFKSGELIDDGTDVTGSNLKVYAKVLDKALNDGVINEDEEEIYLSVAKALLISEDDHSAHFTKVLQDRNLRDHPSLAGRINWRPKRLDPVTDLSSERRFSKAAFSLSGKLELHKIEEVGCNVPIGLSSIEAFRDRNELILVYNLNGQDNFKAIADPLLQYMEDSFAYLFIYSEWFYLGFGNIEEGITYGEMKCPISSLQLLREIDPDSYQLRFQWKGLDNEECSMTFFHKRRIDLSGELFRGIKCYSNRANSAAITHLRKALKEDPMIPTANYYMGMASKWSGDLVAMEEHLLEEIQIRPQCHEAYWELGKFYQKTKATDKAINYLEKSLDYKTFHLESIISLLECYYLDPARYETRIMEQLAILLFLYPENNLVLKTISEYCRLGNKRIEDLLTSLSMEYNPIKDKIERLYKATALMSFGHYGLTAKLLESCLSQEGLAPLQARTLQLLIRRVLTNRFQLFCPKVKELLKPVHDMIKGNVASNETKSFTDNFLVESDDSVEEIEENGKPDDLICPKCGKTFAAFKKSLFKVHVSICKKRVTGL
ncbi:MAG: hypothetical protein CVV64_10610 [Candidatus Wallbacteria bacterium HGW-Wallbacteria-1]|jgi:tetratricopeptide (TPR) repeat protein|uniref:Uncharacterized protein n=1 Tax=Candidatus Wallbacteria bacterium HGW-Wallbacteria-1 TaxID=2013854 RepID=A0A2N1PPF7_9BACT|nr:MAG: hypothetical protein CVV64_10610 [Candidatus Wallbacteria bacterium HGW-Wallbacteria-1]